MSLIKCKECGKEISNKAESCPNCGVKLPKKTSIITWAILASIVIYFIASLFFPKNESLYSGESSYSGARSSAQQECDSATVGLMNTIKNINTHMTSANAVTMKKVFFANSTKALLACDGVDQDKYNTIADLHDKMVYELKKSGFQ